MNRSAITKTEVAKLAGVSHMTVSRVLNNFPYVTSATRKKVRSACRKLKYRPNLIAASLRSKKSRAIGVIVPNFRHPFYARFLDAVEDACHSAGYHIIVIQGKCHDHQSRITWQDFEFLLARQIEGLLIDLPLNKTIYSRLKKEKVPTIFVDLPPKDNRFSFIGTADFDGAREMTRHLIKLGHRKIAFLAGPEEAYTSQERLAGYKTALLNARINYNSELVLHTNYETDGGYEATKKLLSSRITFTAIFSANDPIAIGVLAALQKKSIQVPGKISVAGFTGDEIGAYTHPPLTTMVQPIEEIGRKAVEGLLVRIANPKKPVEKILLPATLLERSSAGPLNL
ncbi:MAG: LacI family DNA-binding transcriptional regulator [Candidatus Omnitrophota bacterium]